MTVDDDQSKRRTPPRASKNSVDAMFDRIERPEWRSPLFWWMIEHHDRLLQSRSKIRRGVTWSRFCADLAAQGITLADGRAVKPATARITWQRVRKEVARVTEESARQLAEQEARRAADPRRNMPSRFPKGDYTPQVSPAPARPMNALVVRSATTPAVAPPMSAREAQRYAEVVEALRGVVVPDFDGTPLDLLQFLRTDGEPEPWESIENPEDRRVEIILVMRERARRWANNPSQRANWRKW